MSEFGKNDGAVDETLPVGEDHPDTEEVEVDAPDLDTGDPVEDDESSLNDLDFDSVDVDDVPVLEDEGDG